MESAVNQKHLVASLVEKANKYRNFARWVGDTETVHRVLGLAQELKQRARALAKPAKKKFGNVPGKSGRKTTGRQEGM